MPPPIVALRQSFLALVTPLIPLSPYWHPAARCALSSGQHDGQVISCCLGLIRGYAELVAAGPGNEQERLALMEAHRADVTVNLAEIHENLKLIDRKIDVYRGRIAAGDADQLWVPNRLTDVR